MSDKFKFIFFGSSPISVTALSALENHGMTPVAVVTQIDKPQGRGLELTATPVKIWAEERRIPVEFLDHRRTGGFRMHQIEAITKPPLPVADRPSLQLTDFEGINERLADLLGRRMSGILCNANIAT